MPFGHLSRQFKFGESYTFPLKAPVSQYVLGISEFCLAFSDDVDKKYSFPAYAVQEMGISLSHNLTNQGVTVNVNGTLLSPNNVSYVPELSHVTVGIFAWTGDGGDAFTLTNENNMPGFGQPITVPEPPDDYLACLSGFHFTFQDKGYDLNQVTIQVEIHSKAANTVTPKAEAAMDGKGEKASWTGDCGLLAASAESGVRADLYSLDSGKTRYFLDKKPEGATGKRYMAFMRGFSVAYDRSSVPLSSIKAGITVDEMGTARVEARMTGGEWVSSGFDIKNFYTYETSVNRVSGITLEY